MAERSLLTFPSSDEWSRRRQRRGVPSSFFREELVPTQSHSGWSLDLRSKTSRGFHIGAMMLNRYEQQRDAILSWAVRRIDEPELEKKGGARRLGYIIESSLSQGPGSGSWSPTTVGYSFERHVVLGLWYVMEVAASWHGDLEWHDITQGLKMKQSKHCRFGPQVAAALICDSPNVRKCTQVQASTEYSHT